MRRKPSPTLIQVQQLFVMFGVDLVARWRALGPRMTWEQQTEAFEKAKKDAKAGYRRLALQHHPDHGGDAEKAKHVNMAWTQLEKISLRKAPPPQPQPSMVVIQSMRFSGVRIYTTDTGYTNGATTGSSVTGDW